MENLAPETSRDISPSSVPFPEMLLKDFGEGDETNIQKDHTQKSNGGGLVRPGAVDVRAAPRLPPSSAPRLVFWTVQCPAHDTFLPSAEKP